MMISCKPTMYAKNSTVQPKFGSGKENHHGSVEKGSDHLV